MAGQFSFGAQPASSYGALNAANAPPPVAVAPKKKFDWAQALQVAGAGLQDTVAGFNGREGHQLEDVIASENARRKQLAQQQALQQVASTITDPAQLAAFHVDPQAYIKAYYEAQKPQTLSEGQALYVGDKQIAARGKTGISDGFAYSTDGATGQLSFGAQRPKTYNEVRADQQDDPNVVGSEAWNRVQGNQVALGNLDVSRGQLGVSRGQLGVAQGNLSLGQQRLGMEGQRFDWERSGGAARNTQAVQAQANLPQVIDTANQFLSDIDKVKNDPQLGWRTGASGVIPAIPGSRGAGFDARVAQLQGQTFLQAYQGLKGGGQITEVEGKKAQEAIARLNRAQSKADFTAALNDLSSVVKTGVARAQRAAMGPPMTPEQAAQLPAGTQFIGTDGIARVKH